MMRKALHFLFNSVFLLLLCAVTAQLQAQNFNPQSLDSLVVWFRADSAVTVAGTAVSKWNDCGGTADDSLIQNTAASRPLYISSASILMNNKPAIQFDSVDDVMNGLTIPNLASSSMTVFVLADNLGQTTTASPGLIIMGASNTGFCMNKAVANRSYSVNNGGANLAAAVNTIPHAGHLPRIYGVNKNLGTSLDLRINGTSVASSAAAAAFVNGQFRVGRVSGSWHGRFYEIIIYNRALSAQERIDVENYLYNKYAPPVNLGADISETYRLCPIVLNASKRFVSYLWNDGSTADTLSVKRSGTYWVRVTDVFGKVSTDTVNVSMPAISISQVNDTAICLGNSINVSAMPTGAYTYLWSNVSTTPNVAISTPGSHFVKITDSNNCSVYTDTFVLSIDTFSTTVSLGNDTSLCVGNVIALVSPATGWQNLVFSWQPGAVSSTTYTVNTSGTYTVQVTNQLGCVGTDAVQVTIAGSAPQVAFTIDTLCLSEAYVPVNSSVSTDASPIASYQWAFGDGGNSSVASPQHTYLAMGQYTVSLTVQTASGCSNTLSQAVQVKDNPVAAFSSQLMGCIQGPMVFTQSSTAATGSNITNYDWYFGDGNTSAQTNVQHIYATAGNYMPKLIVTDNYGCVDTASSNIVIVANAPAPLTPVLTQPASGASLPNNNVTFVWGGDAMGTYRLLVSTDSTFASANTYIAQGLTQTVSLVYNQTYYWKVRAYNICGDSVESQKRTFVVFNPQQLGGMVVWLRADTGVVTVTNTTHVTRWNDNAGIINDSVIQVTQTTMPEYVASSSPLMNYKPSIQFNEAANDVLNGGNIAQLADSSMTVFVLADNTGQQTTASPGVIILGASNTGFCMNKAVANRSYSVNNAGQTVAAPANTIPDAGHLPRIYALTKVFNTSLKMYINSDSVAAASATQISNGAAGNFVNGQFKIGRVSGSWQGNFYEIMIYNRALSLTEKSNVEKFIYDKYAPPVDLGADISQPYSICPVTLNASKRFTNYLWSNGSTADTLAVKASGAYWVRVVDVFGRISTDTINVALPFQGLSVNDTLLCKGNSINVQAQMTNSPYTFLWNTGQNAPSITVGEPGEYVLSITDTNLCTLVIDTLHILVDSFPTVSLLPTDTITCTGNILAIDNNGYSIVDVEWSTSAQTTEITVGSAGIYTVTATDINQCVVSDTIAITIKGIAPVVDFSFSNVCLNNPSIFTDLSTASLPDQINNWAWSFGDTNLGSGQNVNHIYSLPGVYPVSLTVVTDSGCSASIVKNASVFGLPDAVITQLAPICAQNTSRVSGISIAPVGATISGWEWQVGGNIVSLDTFLRYPFPQQGIVPITLIVTTDQGCKDTTTRDIEVYAPFVADFEVANVCVGDSSYFFDVTPSFSVISRMWNFGDATSISGTKDPVKKYNSAGTYNVTLTVTNAIGCRDTSVKTVIAASKPIAKFGNLNGCEDAFYTPLDSSTSTQEPINSWQWTIGSFNYSAQAPQRYFANPGSYPVKLVVRTPTGCADSIAKTAVIHPRPTVNFSYVPLYGDAPLNVTFTNQSTNDSTYLWEFGDGDISTQKNPIHTYTENGNYNVKLTAVSPYGCTASRTKPYTVIQTDLDFAVNEADVQVTPLPDGSSLAEVNIIGSNIGTRIIDHITFYVTLGGVGVIAEDWTGTLYTGEMLVDTFSAKFVVPAGKSDSYICVTAVSVNNGQEELRIDNNSQCFGITEGIKVMGPLPNPALHQSALGLILPKHGKVTIDIANMMGQYIVQGVELDLPEGRTDYELPIGQMVAGEYFIRILYNDEKVVRKFIISR